MIDESNKLLIGYKPKLTYEDEYVSDIKYTDNITEPNEDLNIIDEEIEELIEDTNEIDKLINSLPNNLSNIVEEVYDQISDFIDNELSDKVLEEIPNLEDWIYEDNNDDSDNEIKPDSKPERKPDFSNIWGTEDFFPVKKEEHTETEIVEKEYVKNLVDLFKDYNTELHNILSNFWTNLILATSNKSSSEIRLLLDNIVLSSSEIIESAKHLLDSAVRQQLLKDMKIDYYNMMFNAENTIKHLQQLKAMQELRLRYSKIKEVEGNTKTNQNNNNILKASKYAYNRKYEIAYENLYRYLNSSNRVLKDTLQTWIQEIKSKIDNCDYVYAPISDNNLFEVIDAFAAGEITDLQCLYAISATHLGYQVVIKTQKALQNIDMKKHLYFCSVEKSLYNKESDIESNTAMNKALIAKKRYSEFIGDVS